MSRVFKALKLSLVLLLMMPMLRQCIAGETITHMPQLVQLNNILTNRINSVLKQFEQLRNQTENKEFLQQYESLEMALSLPISQLDEKIMIYHEYLAYENIRQQQEQPDNSKGSRYDQADIIVDNIDKVKQRTIAYTAFEKRVLKILNKLGASDAFTKRVFKAIFSDEDQLKKLKKKLDSLDNDKDNDKDCCLWDFIFGLY